MNLPNKITLSRIFLVPIFMVFIMPIPNWVFGLPVLQNFHETLQAYNHFIDSYGYMIATGIFIFASATDGVDGYIARKRKLVTRLGKFLDPIADKLLITAALLALVSNQSLSGWSAMIIIGREFIVTTLRLIAAGDGIVISASKLGKIKTVSQMIAVGMMLLKDWPFTELLSNYFPISQVMMFIAVMLTIISGVDYLIKNYHVISKTANAENELSN